ncbi:hypothetical protein [Amycolatopsis pigmentata]|uniref:Uncharacterized protein n=1 Tax=Amycolatopsis pigmentata TaxID=450801 RepID=A0ABW5FLH5_9PSEU
MAGDSSVIGRVGELTHATRGQGGPGEVRVKIRGGTEIFLAWSERPLPAGSPVLVVESRGPRAVGVVPWSDLPDTR